MDSGRVTEIRHGQNEPGLLFHDKRHPADLGAPEVTRFLSSLAVEGKVAASTQNQALSALLFLYGEVLEVDLPWMDEIVRAKRPQRLPVVLTRDEVRAVGLDITRCAVCQQGQLRRTEILAPPPDPPRLAALVNTS
jgi:site-specific recombinase XerD